MGIILIQSIILFPTEHIRAVLVDKGQEGTAITPTEIKVLLLKMMMMMMMGGEEEGESGGVRGGMMDLVG